MAQYMGSASDSGLENLTFLKQKKNTSFVGCIIYFSEIEIFNF